MSTPVPIPMQSPEERFRNVLARATADVNVLGFVVFGSRGAGLFATEGSDYDVFLILERADPSWVTRHGDPVEIVPILLADFDRYALEGSPFAWNRPSFLRVRVEIDRLDGGITRMIERKSRLEDAEIARIAPTALDDYVNALFRSLKNARLGLSLASRLDASDSIGPLLTFLFAVDGRVPPFAKYLEVDVAERPLPVADILPRIERILTTADLHAQCALFRAVEEVARERGFGAAVDGWEPDVPFLRGGAIDA